jgi:gluconate 2-dehydrogenase gamma chain
MGRPKRRDLVADSPTQPGPSRRDFVARLGAGASAAWLASIWPEALADAAEAAAATATGQAPKYRVLTAAQANDFGAVADRIIPPDDAPGARAVGVVFFADRMLAGLNADQKPEFDKALVAGNAAARTLVPAAASFVALTTKQQDAVLESIETTDGFALMRAITVAGYFSHPSYGGNRGNAGWKAIGFEDHMMWASPFGYYDRTEVMARLLPRKTT